MLTHSLTHTHTQRRRKSCTLTQHTETRMHSHTTHTNNGLIILHHITDSVRFNLFTEPNVPTTHTLHAHAPVHSVMLMLRCMCYKCMSGEYSFLCSRNDECVDRAVFGLRCGLISLFLHALSIIIVVICYINACNCFTCPQLMTHDSATCEMHTQLYMYCSIGLYMCTCTCTFKYNVHICQVYVLCSCLPAIIYIMYNVYYIYNVHVYTHTSTGSCIYTVFIHVYTYFYMYIMYVYTCMYNV